MSESNAKAKAEGFELHSLCQATRGVQEPSSPYRPPQDSQVIFRDSHLELNFPLLTRELSLPGVQKWGLKHGHLQTEKVAAPVTQRAAVGQGPAARLPLSAA